MKNLNISVKILSYQFEELSADDQQLIAEAKKMTGTSYSPYSCFQVGAAIRLKDGQIFRGSNQENAAYPSGICAERTAFFASSANAPGVAPVAIAIAAQTQGHFTAEPVPPCGMCRQALMEAELRFHQPLRVLLYGEDEIYVCESIQELLPLHFEL